MSTFIAFRPDDRLPRHTIILQPVDSDPDIAFLEYIIQCFETRTNIRPTVFIRFIPDQHATNITQVLQNIAQALVDIPVLIPGQIQNTLNDFPVFQGQEFIKKHTEKPTLFGFNLLALLKQVPIQRLRGILKFFRDNEPSSLGFFWLAVANNVL